MSQSSPSDDKTQTERDALAGQQDGSAGIEALPLPEGPTEIISTEYEIGQDNIEGVKPVAYDIHNPVFMISAAAIVLFTGATLLFPSVLGPFFAGLRDVVTSNFDWFFLIAGNIFVMLCLGL
ncbi:BCCT family transporter, partial [Paracoccus yeei]|uniref:BCCT family transporter n=1 Tax=Paracoccus yeei TaxID=147645 RepID=UPI0037D50527